MLPRGSLSFWSYCKLYFSSTHSVYTFQHLFYKEGKFSSAISEASFSLDMPNIDVRANFFFSFFFFTKAKNISYLHRNNRNNKTISYLHRNGGTA